MEPMNILTFENDGPLLVASDYWQSETAAAGKLYVSINAGCFSACSSLRASTRSFPICAEKPNTSSSQCCQRDKWVDREYCLEWMVEDGSDSPRACTFLRGDLTALRTTKTSAKNGAAASGTLQKVALTNAWSAQPTTSSSRIALAPQNYWPNKQLRVSVTPE